MKKFFVGVPTDIDVRLLRDKFGVPEIGAEIDHRVIEETISHRRETFRYKTVVTVWRKKLLRDHNILLTPVPTVGYVVAGNKQRVDHCSRKSKSAVRLIVKSSAIAERTDEKGLDEKDIVLRRRMAMNGAAVRLAMATTANAMATKGTK